MPARDPRMLPGISARTSSLIGGFGVLQFLIVLFLGIPAAIAVNFATHWTNRTGLTFLAVLGASFAVAAIVGGIFLPFSRSKQRRELATGYTTILTEFNQVDGISVRTGQVVRPAKIELAGLRVGDTFTTGEELGAIELGRTALQAALRMRSFVIPMVASIVALFGGFLWFWSVGSLHDWDPPARDQGIIVVLVFVCIAGLCGVITAPLLALLFYIPRYFRARLAEYFPDAHVYIGVPDNGDIATELVDPSSPALPGARYRMAGFVVVDKDAIVLFSRSRSTALPYLLVPRIRITAASIGSTSAWSSNNIPYPAVALTVRKENDTTIDLQLDLAITKGGVRSPQIRDDCQYVVDWARPSEAKTMS